MHDLGTITALGEAQPCVDRFAHITIAENDGLALASVAARVGREEACRAALAGLLGAVPDVGKAVLGDPEAGFWTGPEQWMIGAPHVAHASLPNLIKSLVGDAGSVADQTGAWVTFDITGSAMADVCERLCAVPIRRMATGDVQRTTIHQLGCFVIRREADDHIRVLGPRSCAKTLHHALLTAAHSTA